MDSIAQDKKRNVAGQVSLFELGGGRPRRPSSSWSSSSSCPSSRRMCCWPWSGEMTGVYISGHPLDGVRDLLEQLPANTLMIAQAAEEEVSGGCATVTRSSWAV